MATTPRGTARRALFALVAFVTVAAAAASIGPARAGDSSTQIVGGTRAATGEFPWMVSLGQPQYGSSDFARHTCGGSVVAAQWVLTAAHCVVGTSASSWVAVLGETNLTNDNGDHVTISRIVRHPSYNSRTSDNDLALMQLSSSTSIVPMPLAATADAPLYATGQSVRTMGWGATREGGAGSTAMLYVDLPVVSDTSCNSYYGGIVAAHMLCAGAQAGKDSCQGDSGGPLVARRSDGSWIQAGIVSFGDGCARSGVPGVYTQVDAYKSWIESYTGGTTPPPPPTYTVSLAAARSSVPVGSSSTLTATANTDVGPTPYNITILEGSTVRASCSTGTTCTYPATSSSAQTRQFVARISAADGSGSQAQSSTVSVTWTAGSSYSVTLGATSTSPTIGQKVTLTATSNVDVGPTPYYLVIMEGSTLRKRCASGTTCTYVVSASTAKSRTFTARIATNTGANPQATSAPVTVTWR